MPILRRAPDNTLAETIGKFAGSFGNPQSWAEAQLLQRRILMQDLEYQEKMKQIQAKQMAIEMYRRMPGMPQEKVPELINMLMNGTPLTDVATHAAFLSGNFDTSGTPEADMKNRRFIFATTGKWPEGPLPVPTGANQAQIEAGMAREAGQKAGAERYAQDTASQAARAGIQFEDNPNDPASYQRDVGKFIQLEGKAPPADWVPGNNWRQVMDRYQGDLAAKKAADLERAKQGVAGIPPTGNVFPDNPPFQSYPSIGSGGVNPQLSQPGPASAASPPASAASPPAAPAPPASGAGGSSANITQPSPLPGTYTQPTQIIRDIGGGYHQIGQTPTEADAAKSRTALDQGNLTKAYEGMSAAAQLNDKLQQMAALTQYLKTSGVGGQLGAGVMRFMQDHWGMTIGNAMQARARLNQIIQSELPELVKESNARFAGPEIKPFSAQLGTADQPPEVLLSNIARQQAQAEMLMQRAHDAGQVLNTKTMTPDQYYAADEARLKNLPTTVQELQRKYGITDVRPGAFGASPNVGPSSPTPAPTPAGPQVAGPPEAAAPAPGGPRIFQMNPNGTIVMPGQQ